MAVLDPLIASDEPSVNGERIIAHEPLVVRSIHSRVALPLGAPPKPTAPAPAPHFHAARRPGDDYHDVGQLVLTNFRLCV
ncbi:hypothetical protein H696_03677 [Fonticula alba]|uniref:Uncharacterized protein n=1 Tax=Fonticula alba TaxID=691883 RepID=A0A058Z541_FONAL|nr:hypothetical protein H696_03677 [Fonticula alba]KCV69251.1 hypothetical protein H696_03677 [Fonticula alba]|eukprot:XP_009495816.1 hypothetical protein H696_03677 [Fonticula alba]